MHSHFSYSPASRLLHSVFAQSANAGTSADLNIDVVESDAAFTLRADIPGASKDDVSVSIDGNTVKLEVVFKDDPAVDAGQPVWRERRVGKVSRALKFGQPIDGDGAIAKQEHGVLTLTLPKKGNAQVKRVTIQ
jgi:HSP20 family protein